MKDDANAPDALRAILVIFATIPPLALILFFGAAPYIGLRIGQDEALEMVELVLPLFTGYLGTIVGFYFGKKS